MIASKLAAIFNHPHNEKNNEDDYIVVDDKVRFSQSILWHNEKKYYAESGIQPWTEALPFYITSNPFIATAYAKMTLGFIQDYINKNPEAISHPFHIIELGAGTGKFSFYFLKNLLSLMDDAQVNSVIIRYVMTDLSDNSFSFFEKHHALQPFLEAGILDFSVYDLYRGGDIFLHRAQRRIDITEIKNPPILIANYVFDSISSDVFTVREGVLYESLVTVKTPPANLNNGVLIDCRKITIQYSESLMKEQYYNNEFDNILLSYANKLNDTHFSFPISALSALNQFQKNVKKQFLLLTSDKGILTAEKLNRINGTYESIIYHGNCFSFGVNYHAIAAFLEASGGNSLISSESDCIVTAVLSSGFKSAECPRLVSAAVQLGQFSLGDYSKVSAAFLKNHETATLDLIHSYLNFFSWDTFVFFNVFPHVKKLIEESNPRSASLFMEGCAQLEENFYAIPKNGDVLFKVGLLFQNVKSYEKALVFYEKSILHSGETEIILYNIGMCHYKLSQKREALSFFQKALDIAPGFEYARECHHALTKEIREEQCAS